MSTSERPGRVLFVLSGSIAAYKACHAVSRLVQAGCEVQTVATPAALRFVGAATLEGLTGRPPATDTFEPGRAMDHIHLVRWADVTVVCPASADLINRLAAGLADDLVGTMFLARETASSYLVAPAMNASMYPHPATQRSIATLRSWGVEFLEPDSGALACGEIGPGRLADPDEIVAAVLHRLAAPADGPAVAARRLRIVLTSGGTKVPIDGVRAITNTSSGRTGAALADHLAARGHDVTLIHATGAVLPRCPVALVPYTTFGDLDDALRAALAGGDTDAVVHLAAVSDYDVDHLEVDGRRVEAGASGKLDSVGELTVHLRRTPKLLAGLRGLAGERAVIVGFKLTNGASAVEQAAAVAAVARHADLVVHNDLGEMSGSAHPATIYRGDRVVAATADNESLAVALDAAIGDEVDARSRVVG